MSIEKKKKCNLLIAKLYHSQHLLLEILRKLLKRQNKKDLES